MQNNGLIKLFAILFGLVSIYQLSFTFITNQKESQAKEYAIHSISEDTLDLIQFRENPESIYHDSIGNILHNGIIPYNDAKSIALTKGIGLKGGINVIRQD